MKRTLLLVFFVISYSPLYSQWEFINPLPDGYSMSCVSFSDSSNGFALGDRFIRHFVNNQWVCNPPDTATPFFSRVKMLSATNGWAIAGNGNIYHYTAGTWQLNYLNTIRLNDIEFTSPTSGWAVGDSGTVLHYDGISWTIKPCPLNDKLLSVYFINDTVGYVGSINSKLLKYSNGNFTQISMSPFSNIYDVNDIYASDTNNIYVASIIGKVMHYDGNTWTMQITPSPNTLTRIWFTDPQHGWAIGTGNQILFYDGISWSEQFVDTLFNYTQFRDMCFTSATNGWIVGSFGAMIHFDGVSWSKINTAFTYSHLYDVFAIDTSHVFVSGILGTYMDIDTGWVKAPDPLPNPYNRKMDFYDANYGWASSITQNMRFWNGSVWTSQQPFPGGYSVFDVDVVDTNHVWACGGASGIILFWNGNTWVQQNAIGSVGISTLKGIAMIDTANGWACGENGKVIQYQNGTWSNPLPGFSTNEFFAIEFTDANHGWMVERLYSAGEFFAVIHFYNGTNWNATDTIPYFGAYDGTFHFRDSLHGTLGIGLLFSYLQYDNGNWTIKKIEGAPSVIHSVFFLDSLNGWAVGNGGTVMQTRTGGFTSLIDEQQNVQSANLNLKCYPNPINELSTISYNISGNSFVSLVVYNNEGKKMNTLINSFQSKGYHALEFNKNNLSPGIYYLVLRIDRNQEAIKIVVDSRD